ncbi:hypothetical protein KUV50_17640 [Membranicola marinus]|uniref:Lipoprotein n=1 Tax=Membranihabitans marinus TaxID=1227546 RepID=A0A953HS83_9BACT|nr:hypothetical protein [Membranihabitans marinus]MBY5959978.1 hypothetical protein [Membranihabitans marinus]
MTKFTFKIHSIFILLCAVCWLSACSKTSTNTDCHAGFSLHQVTSAEVEKYSNAAADYAQDPTPETCNRYKDAMSSYIDVLEIYEKCALEYGSIEDWRSFINSARTALSDLDCQ